MTRYADGFAFLRRRAERLWAAGDRAGALCLMRRLDTEQARRFRCRTRAKLRAVR